MWYTLVRLWRYWTGHTRPSCRIVKISAYSGVQLPWLHSTHPSSTNPQSKAQRSHISISHFRQPQATIYGALDNSGSVARLVLPVSIPSSLSMSMPGSSNPPRSEQQATAAQSSSQQMYSRRTFHHSLAVAPFIWCHHVPSLQALSYFCMVSCIVQTLSCFVSLISLAHPRGTIGM